IRRLLKINRTTGIKARSLVSTYDVGFTNAAEPLLIADMDALFRSVGVDMTLSLSHSVDLTLLHGVGYARGLPILRAAAQLTHGAIVRGRSARILCFAYELSTPNVRYELDAAARCVDLSQLCIAGVLFSDAAAANVLCNDLGMQEGVKLSINSLRPCDKLNFPDFDWALHPGGQLIIEKVKQAMGLSEDQLRATYETYKTRGNSSSPSVLIVMDKLRSGRSEKDFVIATAFGLGLATEMSMLRRCSDNDDVKAEKRR
ncbi:hypothetical protein D6C93_06351, partial [Aureobasidium pullulans]